MPTRIFPSAARQAFSHYLKVFYVWRGKEVGRVFVREEGRRTVGSWRWRGRWGVEGMWEGRIIRWREEE